ncbi:MAG: UvrD-helicase domain-containing protein [Candidatus Schekmanbacteria bacterium]|nr:UvrD-helicase domain-containing protein [Candidatus Schekmanbacteria bacterium]
MTAAAAGLRIRHQVISAAAGAGKTFQLSNRYLALLAAGVAPDRIVALTFTRKAAGEIFDRILERLARAAGSEGGAARLRAEVEESGIPVAQLTQQRAIALLRALLDALHLCRVGTLDSFFVALVRAFPFELGVGASFELVDGYAAEAATDRALRRMLAGGGARALDARHRLLAAIKQRSFGREARTVTSLLRETIDAEQETFLDAPREEVWGEPGRIWESPPGWRAGAQVNPEAALAAALAGLANNRALTASRRTKLVAFAVEAGRLTPGAPLDTLIDMLGKLAPLVDELESGRAAVNIHGQFQLEGAACAPLAALTRYALWCEWARCLEQTKGLYRILASYQSSYERFVRAQGKLKFADVTFLLGKSDGQAIGGNRSYVDYRLDGRFDHWLLDEFQDTSALQWHAVRNLLDEVIQDDSGQRSLFYVGDVKQAIYGWRGGHYRLFDYVAEAYDAGGEVFETRRLSRSWRSSPVVIDAVNRVFDSLSPASGADAEAVAAFQRGWRRHETALADLAGHVVLYGVSAAGNEAEKRAQRHEVAVALARRLRHEIGEDRTLAILVRANDQGLALVQRLRTAGVPAVWEGNSALTDNPFVVALLSLIQYSHHPADSVASEHLLSTPLARWIADGACIAPGVAVDVLRRIRLEGFAGVVRRWAQLCGDARLLDAFALRRARDLESAALIFDATGETSGDSFCAFVRGHRLQDAAGPSDVRVLTIHKAKGLEFDAVILPELETGLCRGLVKDTVVANREDPLSPEPDWVLSVPSVHLLRLDDRFRSVLARHATEQTYESLCLLYVAITRARQALHLVVDDGDRGAGVRRASGLVRAGLTDGETVAAAEVMIENVAARILYEGGTPGWAARGGARAMAATAWSDRVPLAIERAMQGRAAETSGAATAAVSRQLPAASETWVAAAASLFSSDRRLSLQVGAALHRLFERIEWAEDGSSEVAVESLRAHGATPPGVRDEAIRRFRAALARAGVAEVLRRPHGAARLWRERPFEAMVEGRWVSGRFDRVVLCEDGDGKLARATVIEFKTDRLATAPAVRERAAAYRAQVVLYRKALAKLTGLPESAVEGMLVFVESGELVAVW